MDHVVVTVNGVVVYDSTPVVESPSVVNPFVAWKAQGFDLAQVMEWKFQRALTEDEWAQALAAGYTREAPSASAPAVDTSADRLPFNLVEGGIPVKLTGPKTITGCPASVIVRVFPASSDSSTHVDYKVTINGSTYPATGISEFDTGSRGIPVSGPEVTVSVDSPGFQFQIQ